MSDNFLVILKNPVIWVAVSFLVACLILPKRKKGRHARYKRKARKIYRKLQSTKYTNAQKLNYLRRINPYVFEELVLAAFLKKGFKIKRNQRYSGDGGIDGMVFYEGKGYPLQCKRYRSHINVKHVEDFANLCRVRGESGYFIHTGRTGKASKRIVKEFNNITIISGNRLLSLLSDRSDNE